MVWAIASFGCGGSKPPENASGKTDTSASKKDDDTSAKESASSDADGGAGTASGDAPKKDECIGFEVGDIEQILNKSACEEPNVRPDSIPNMETKGKLDVTVSASSPRVPPGGKADLVVTFANKTKQNMTLHFRIDPVPRFEAQVFDAKGKRAEMPTGNPPPPPKGATQPPASEAKAAKLTLAANGTARMRVPWEAVKTKWAPDKYKGTPPERGYPRSPAGPLPKGKYTIKVVTPLVGVNEGSDHEVSTPKIDIEVGG
jgi:hypothetical protein